MVLLNKSVLKSGSTFGQQLLSIRYSNISKFKKVLYLLANTLDYCKNRLELWNPSHGINNTIHNIHFVLILMNFLNISIFLRNGVKPLLIERFLGLNQEFAKEKSPRLFESKYLARELVWNGFIVSLPINVITRIESGTYTKKLF